MLGQHSTITSVKRLLGLGLAIAIGALALMPTAVEAEPHFYKNGVVVEEGELGDLGSSGLDTISWGTVTFTGGVIGTVRCEYILLLDIKNPVGGGAGQAAVDGFAPYDCTGPVCEAASGKFEVIPEGLKEGKEWTGVLTEPVPGEFRLKVGNKEEASPTKIQFEVVCVVSQIKSKFHGELSPKVLNGTEIGIAPSKLEFNSTSGTLESSSGTAEVVGKLKILGYEGQELLTAKNP